jgi:pyruvate/2-oxoglutarate dehydrogenase complex dihydrolipoamide dehydrogenase (E3) component
MAPRCPTTYVAISPRLWIGSRRVRSRISRRRAARELKARGVDVFFREARFTSQEAITVNGETLRFKRALIAPGARPVIPSIPGFGEAG